MSKDKDELIEAQKQVIGILFEIIRRFQANSDLDQQYLKMILDKDADTIKLDAILDQRKINADTIKRLLEMLDD